MYDVIIIGSGLGGLVCANLLSKKGLKVLVLERQHQPGGCLQSYRRGTMMYDTGLHYVGGLAEGQPLHDIFKELELLSLPWQKLDANGFDHIMIGDREYRFAEGYENFLEMLAKDFPEDRDSLQRYIQLMQCTDEVWMQQTNAYGYLSNIRRKIGETGIVYVALDACHAGSSYRGEEEEDTVYVRGSEIGFSKTDKTYTPRINRSGSYRIATEKGMAPIYMLEACRAYEVNLEIKQDGKYYGPMTYYISRQLLTLPLSFDIKWIEDVRSCMEKDNRLARQHMVTESSE